MSNGRAVVIVTHDSRLLEFADRMVRIEDGLIASSAVSRKFPRKCCCGRTQAVAARPRQLGT